MVVSGVSRCGQGRFSLEVGRPHQAAQKRLIDRIAVGEVVVGDESVQGVVAGAGGDQQATTEQGHQRMGLLLEAAGESDASDFEMVAQGGEPGLDAGIDMFQIGLASIRQISRFAVFGQSELEPRGAGEAPLPGSISSRWS